MSSREICLGGILSVGTPRRRGKKSSGRKPSPFEKTGRRSRGGMEKYRHRDLAGAMVLGILGGRRGRDTRHLGGRRDIVDG